MPATDAAAGNGSAPGSQALTVEPAREPSAWHGQVTISETTDPDGRAISRVAARFVALTSEAQARRETLERALDACTRVPDLISVPGSHDETAAPTDTLLPIAVELLVADVDVGQAIVLSSPSGTWSTLLPSVATTELVYLNDSDASRIDGRIPSGLVIDIPGGGDYPGFASIALPDPLPGADSFTPPANSAVRFDTGYRWSANPATGSRVRLAIRDTIGRLDCFAADDGRFSLVEASIEGEPLNGPARLIGVAREATRIERRGNVTLVLTVATETP